jgi:ankyrin
MNRIEAFVTLASLLLALSPGDQTFGSEKTKYPLVEAAQRGDVTLVKSLLAQEQEANERDSALHAAVRAGRKEVVALLLSHGTNVNSVRWGNFTPLSFAVAEESRFEVLQAFTNSPFLSASRNGSEEIVKLLAGRNAQLTIHGAASMGDIDAMERLVGGGIGVNRLDIQGQTALHAAVAAGQVRAVEWLIAHGANVNLPDDKEATALSLALGIAHGYDYSPDPNQVARFTTMENKQRDIITLLIRHRAELDFSYGMPQETVLSHAAQVADLLIAAGQNLEPSGDNKATLLHRAAWWGNRKAVEGLIELGADLNAVDERGGTPLHAALQSGCTRYWDVLSGPHWDVLRLLIEHGANVNAGNNEKMTALHGAAGSGHTEAIKLLLDHGANVDATTREKVTPLHCAAGGGHTEEMELLITRGADPNAQDDGGGTALLLLLSRHALLRDGAKRPAKDFALKLIRQGVRVDVQNQDGVTPLQEAAALGFPDLLEEMLSRGAPVIRASATGWTALHSAVAGGNAKCVEMLLRRGAQVNGMGRLPDMICLPKFGWPARTPLHIAASQGDNHVIQMLIEHGADVNAKDGSGKTPLHLARENKRTETIELLSSKGADPNIPAAEPWIPGRPDHSPIAQAQARRQLALVESLAAKAPAALLTSRLFQEVESGYSELIPVLVARGADVNAHESLRRETPLHRAVDKKNLKAIESLLAQGADINSKDVNNETPLGAAVYRGQKETVSLLLSHGADVNVAYTGPYDLKGGIPLHVALRFGHFEIAKMLVLKGSNVNAVGTGEGVTPLHLALKDRALLELMLEHGGQIDSRSTDGMTLLHGAAGTGQHDLAQYLLAKGAAVNVQDRNGNTPLHLAAKGGHRALCTLLISRQADANIRNKKGLLPRDYTQASGIEDAIPEPRAVPRRGE